MHRLILAIVASAAIAFRYSPAGRYGSAPARVTVDINTSGASAVLAAATADPDPRRGRGRCGARERLPSAP